MKPRYRLSRDGVRVIERFEGFRAKAARLENGGWTVGFGHTKTAREGTVIDRDDAEALLLYDLIEVSHGVNELVFTPLSQNQFDALVAFAFSIGVKNFASSAVLRRLNEGRLLEAAYAMEMWRKAKVGGEVILVDALVRRRAAEKALFLTPTEGLAPTPSPVLRPQLDYEVISPPPREGVQTEARDEPLTARPPSASEAAAAELGARLEGLLKEQDAPADAPQPLEAAPPEDERSALVLEVVEIAPEPVEPSPTAEAIAPIAPAASTTELPKSPFTAQPSSVRPAGTRPSAVAAAERLAAELGGRRRHAPMEFRLSRADTTSLAMLLLGLVLFLLGLAAGVHGAAGLAPLGWLFGLIGVAVACVGFYRLLQRLLDEHDA